MFLFKHCLHPKERCLRPCKRTPPKGCIGPNFSRNLMLERTFLCLDFWVPSRGPKAEAWSSRKPTVRTVRTKTLEQKRFSQKHCDPGTFGIMFGTRIRNANGSRLYFCCSKHGWHLPSHLENRYACGPPRCKLYSTVRVTTGKWTIQGSTSKSMLEAVCNWWLMSCPFHITVAERNMQPSHSWHHFWTRISKFARERNDGGWACVVTTFVLFPLLLGPTWDKHIMNLFLRGLYVVAHIATGSTSCWVWVWLLQADVWAPRWCQQCQAIARHHSAI